MKKIFCFLIGVLLLNNTVEAAPGDTTWVQANIAQLSNYGNYDSTISFPAPGTTYRKIYMIFTLGKYVCPGSPTYCGDWDYTVQNYLMIPGGDTLELGRLITPYANASAPRTPWTWTQHYVYDVTDYANQLHNTNTMRIFYSGYSGGFTADIKFAFIEGTPDRNVVGLRRLWYGSFGYGGVPDINTHFTALPETAPVGTQSADLKFTVTGHGSDASYCNEFCSHNYQVMLNGSSIATQTVWRDNCGSNELYPQSGTWVYQRANWCPGALVYSNVHNLPGITAGSSYNVALQFDPYTSSGGASYTTEATLIYHGGMNKTLDASLDNIIAPTNDENQFRKNPVCGSPVVHIKNTGATAITSVAFQYGLQDSAMLTYTWPGSLNSLQEADITLPALPQLSTIAGTSGTYTFVATIVTVNGVADDDATNNTMKSQLIAAPLWPVPFKVVFKTNNEPATAFSTVSETSWIIYDAANTAVAQRTGASLSTLYTDTVFLPSGFYKLVIYDSSCDGLQWWAAPSGTTAGYLNVRKLPNTNLPMHGYNYSGTFNNDFGCGFTQYFYVLNPGSLNAITNVSETSAQIEAYPNPARDIVYVDITGLQQIKGKIRVIDALGRVISEMPGNNQHLQIDVSAFASGVYTVLFINEASGNKLQTRLLIAK